VFDSYFVKAMMLSQATDEVMDETFGAVTPGATFRYLVTTLNDKPFIRVAA